MIGVEDLDNIARARIDDAKTLLAAGRFDSASYLSGYAVEVALKARICRTLRWMGFPNTNAEFQRYKSFQTHELPVLLRLSGYEIRIKETHMKFWNVVESWTVDVRYNAVGSVSPVAAAAMVQAAEQILEGL
jgi:HEPN domain-containing protein